MRILALSEIVREVDFAFKLLGVISAILFIGIVIAMLYFTIRYRRGATPRTTQIHGHLLLELTWVILPTILVTYMFFIGYRGFSLMRDVPDDAMVVEVTGQQWIWSFYYPDLDITIGPEELYLPGDRAVKFLLHSPLEDVVHSFYLPAFRNKEDCVPGKSQYMWIHTDMPDPGQEDRFNIFCAEFCGKDHSKMRAELIVLRPDAYRQWAEKMIAEKNKPVVMDVAMNPDSDDILDRDGAKLYQQYCKSCHGNNGLGEVESKTADARNFTTLQDWKQGTKRTEIFRTLITGVKGTQMRSFGHLSAWDRFALVHYVSAFYQGDDRPTDSPEEVDALRVEYALDTQKSPKKEISIEKAMEVIVADAH